MGLIAMSERDLQRIEVLSKVDERRTMIVSGRMVKRYVGLRPAVREQTIALLT
ncbi:hypothetical protein AAII07_54555 [Microvirga sp. 0TCS3.31]